MNKLKLVSFMLFISLLSACSGKRRDTSLNPTTPTPPAAQPQPNNGDANNAPNPGAAEPEASAPPSAESGTNLDPEVAATLKLMILEYLTEEASRQNKQNIVTDLQTQLQAARKTLAKEDELNAEQVDAIYNGAASLSVLAASGAAGFYEGGKIDHHSARATVDESAAARLKAAIEKHRARLTDEALQKQLTSDPNLRFNGVSRNDLHVQMRKDFEKSYRAEAVKKSRYYLAEESLDPYIAEIRSARQRMIDAHDSARTKNLTDLKNYVDVFYKQLTTEIITNLTKSKEGYETAIEIQKSIAFANEADQRLRMSNFE